MSSIPWGASSVFGLHSQIHRPEENEDGLAKEGSSQGISIREGLDCGLQQKGKGIESEGRGQSKDC